MLSVLACYSYYLLIPVWALTLGVEDWLGERLKARRPLRLNLWIIAALIVIFAVDFAVVSQHREYSGWVRLQTCAFDVAVIAVPIAVNKWRSATLIELWNVACIVGLVGTLAIPAIAVP